MRDEKRPDDSAKLLLKKVVGWSGPPLPSRRRSHYSEGTRLAACQPGGDPRTGGGAVQRTRTRGRPAAAAGNDHSAVPRPPRRLHDCARHRPVRPQQPPGHPGRARETGLESKDDTRRRRLFPAALVGRRVCSEESSYID